MIRPLLLALLLLTAPAHADPALFVVRGGPAPLYLFGSIHVLRHGHRFMTPVLEAAYRDSQACWFEDIEKPSVGMLLGLLGGFDTRHPLRPQLDPEDRQRLEEKLEKTMPGAMPIVDYMRPWLAAMTVLAADIGAHMTAEVGAGVDDQLMTLARRDGKPLHGLETLRSIVTLMNNIPQADQIAMLHATLAPTSSDGTALVDLEDAWQQGDLDRLVQLTSDLRDSSPELHGALLTQRNALWAEQIDGLLKAGQPVLITVGAAHLAGEGNLRELLTARGYAVERVQ